MATGVHNIFHDATEELLSVGCQSGGPRAWRGTGPTVQVRSAAAIGQNSLTAVGRIWHGHRFAQHDITTGLLGRLRHGH